MRGDSFRGGVTVSFYIALGVLFSHVSVDKVAAQDTRDMPAHEAVATSSVAVAEEAEQQNGELDVRADRLDYDREAGVIVAQGNVSIRQGDQLLRANRVRVHVPSSTAEAFGNVVLRRGGELWRGERLKYDFKTRRADSDEFRYTADPYYIKAEKTTREDGKIVLHRARLTTCRYEEPHEHYHIRVKKLVLEPNEYLAGRGSTWFFGRVPILYLPYWKRNLNEDFGWRFYPGQSSRMGTFLLSSYRYRLNPALTGRTHVDYRSRRGVAFGQDIMWRTEATHGKIRAYYLDDDEPFSDDDDPVTTQLDNERYRIRVENSWDLSERNKLRVQGQYLSDTRVLADFFEEEFRQANPPDNYVSLSHRGEQYTADLVFRGRLNDFYGSINRLPELSLRMQRQPIIYTPLFYEGFATASHLERVFPVYDTDNQDYSVFRFDTKHTLYYPYQYFGFLNIIPRAGLNGTYYDDSYQWVTEQTVITTVQTNFLPGSGGTTNTEVVTVTEVEENRELRPGGGNVFRTIPEAGLEVSFRAYKAWMAGATPYRHVAEPYLDMSYAAEPNVLSEELLQFDDVDTKSKRHDVLIGMRNKWQTKWNKESVDLVDINTYTVYSIERPEGADALEWFYIDGEMRPSENLLIYTDAAYHITEGELNRFNLRVTKPQAHGWELSGEYRYRVDESSLVAGDLTLYPIDAFDLNLYARYEFEYARFEEYGGYLQRNLDCMHIRLGGTVMPGYTRTDGREVDDDWRVMIAFWLSAFPDVGLSTKYKN